MTLVFSGVERVLVTGGTGFFGRALLRDWLNRVRTGAPVPTIEVWSRNPEAFLQHHPQYRSQDGLTFRQVNVCDLSAFPQPQPFTHVLHLATDSTHGAGLAPLHRFDSIVHGTRHVLEYARRCGLPRFVLASSGAVYGRLEPDATAFVESDVSAPDPMDLNQAYGCAKRAAETLGVAFSRAYGLDVVVARCFTFAGPDLPLDVHFAVGNFVRDALNADAIHVQGDGTAVRSYLDQRDLVVWLWWLARSGRSGQAYNVGSDEPISMAELAQRIAMLHGANKPVRILRQIRTSLRNRYLPNTQKIQSESGIRPRYTLDDALRSMLLEPRSVW